MCSNEYAKYEYVRVAGVSGLGSPQAPFCEYCTYVRSTHLQQGRHNLFLPPPPHLWIYCIEGTGESLLQFSYRWRKLADFLDAKD
jgi:hypothetical protein